MFFVSSENSIGTRIFCKGLQDRVREQNENQWNLHRKMKGCSLKTQNATAAPLGHLPLEAEQLEAMRDADKIYRC